MNLKERLFPWSANISPRISINLSTLWGLGNLRAPGTWGSAVGVLFYLLFFDGLSFWTYIILAALVAYAAVGICDAAERHLKMRDPGKIILDEFVAMPFCYIAFQGQSYTTAGILVGFALFRFFDIKKPYFINDVQRFEGGLGCVADDVAAALCTAICLNILAWMGMFARFGE